MLFGFSLKHKWVPATLFGSKEGKRQKPFKRNGSRWEDNIKNVFENRVLRRTFGPKRNEVTRLEKTA
jgi:hypothetical protein